jgi:hypothetical protein
MLGSNVELAFNTIIRGIFIVSQIIIEIYITKLKNEESIHDKERYDGEKLNLKKEKKSNKCC